MKTFLKVPQKVDHALLLATSLADRKQPLSLDEIARNENISQGYLEEVARLLRAAGLIKGQRGARGGYVLARDARDITVAEVITALEGKCWSDECLGEKEAIGETATTELWRKVQGQVMTTLHRMTVADLAEEAV